MHFLCLLISINTAIATNATLVQELDTIKQQTNELAIYVATIQGYIQQYDQLCADTNISKDSVIVAVCTAKISFIEKLKKRLKNIASDKKYKADCQSILKELKEIESIMEEYIQIYLVNYADGWFYKTAIDASLSENLDCTFIKPFEEEIMNIGNYIDNNNYRSYPSVDIAYLARVRDLKNRVQNLQKRIESSKAKTHLLYNCNNIQYDLNSFEQNLHQRIPLSKPERNFLSSFKQGTSKGKIMGLLTVMASGGYYLYVTFSSSQNK